MLSLASPINTPYHRLPPTLKFAFLCGFTFAVFMTENSVHLAAAFLLVWLCMHCRQPVLPARTEAPCPGLALPCHHTMLARCNR